MKALLLVAHGSRRAASNDEIRMLTEKLAQQSGDRFEHVQCAFLELAEPSIPDGIQQCIDHGATGVTVLPYFLSAGRHVQTDIPEEVAIKVNEHPDVDIQIASYLGSAAAIPGLLLDMLD
ncbi:MAG: sirohydrochlorin chelatase [bacterium]